MGGLGGSGVLFQRRGFPPPPPNQHPTVSRGESGVPRIRLGKLRAGVGDCAATPASSLLPFPPLETQLAIHGLCSKVVEPPGQGEDLWSLGVPTVTANPCFLPSRLALSPTHT